MNTDHQIIQIVRS